MLKRYYVPPHQRTKKKKKRGLLQLNNKKRFAIYVAFALLCWVGILSSNFITSGGDDPRNAISMALHNRWKRFLLYLHDPKTKMLKQKINGSGEDVDILVLVMGEANSFNRWYKNLKDIHTSPNISLIYASYDSEIVGPRNKVNVNVNVNGNGKDIKDNAIITSTTTWIPTPTNPFDFTTIHIPETTWTEGRNLLAEEALRKEKARGKEYSYWFFLDDDVEPICHPATEKVFGPGSCWKKIFTYLGSEAVPEKASTVVLPSYLKDGFVATSNVNGLNAAFKRDRVPYLLPYATLDRGFSEWISQAANMCIISSCMANSVVFVPLIYATNTKYRENNGISREGYTIKNIRTTIAQNFHDRTNGFTPCSHWDKIRYYAEGEFVGNNKEQLLGPFATAEELNKRMSNTNTTYCKPLIKRFAEWEQRVLEAKPAGETKKTTWKKKDIIVMVMGEAKSLQTWVHRLRDIHTAATTVNLSLLFASHDKQIPSPSDDTAKVVVSLPTDDHNHNNNDTTTTTTTSTTTTADSRNNNSKQQFDYETVYIPDATWTEGRNLMAEKTLREEKLRGKEFSYWVFLDDYIEPICHPGSVKVLGGGSCWQKIFNFISSNNNRVVPNKVSTIVLPWSTQQGYASTSNADSLFAAFKRDTVPYLLPYATLPKESSEWLSQAANYCVMNTCLPDSAVYVPYVSARNTKQSRPYIREGYDLQNIQTVVALNLQFDGFAPCKDWTSVTKYAQGEHGTGIVGPFKTATELNQQIPTHKRTLCSPLRDRFAEWEKNVTMMTTTS